MLDKSLPYYKVLMRRKGGLPIPPIETPEGFSFTLYQPGDEKAWAQIEASVLEFDDEIDALLFFQKSFLPYAGELERRCLFLQNAQGKKMGTVTAWWDYIGNARAPWLHWVSLRPECQGKGLGTALLSRSLQLMADIEGDRDIYLSTQTWSHVAVKLYQKMGFEILLEPKLGKHDNKDAEKAIAILESLDQSRDSKPKDNAR